MEIDNQPFPPLYPTNPASAPKSATSSQIPHTHQVRNPHDVLISDIQHETLETLITTELGIAYLSKVLGFLYV